MSILTLGCSQGFWGNLCRGAASAPCPRQCPPWEAGIIKQASQREGYSSTCCSLPGYQGTECRWRVGQKAQGTPNGSGISMSSLLSFSCSRHPGLLSFLEHTRLSDILSARTTWPYPTHLLQVHHCLSISPGKLTWPPHPLPTSSGKKSRSGYWLVKVYIYAVAERSVSAKVWAPWGQGHGVFIAHLPDPTPLPPPPHPPAPNPRSTLSASPSDVRTEGVVGAPPYLLEEWIHLLLHNHSLTFKTQDQPGSKSCRKNIGWWGGAAGTGQSGDGDSNSTTRNYAAKALQCLS